MMGTNKLTELDSFVKTIVYLSVCLSVTVV